MTLEGSSCCSMILIPVESLSPKNSTLVTTVLLLREHLSVPISCAFHEVHEVEAKSRIA
jgi:hypothetical protein